MKSEITPENKAKFFAQYWGQDVLSSDMYGDNGTIYSLTMKEDSCNDKWLLLKPLSSISDEDAIEVAKIACPELFHTRKSGHYIERREFENGWITVKHDINYKSVDIDIDGYILVYNESDDGGYDRNPNMVHAIDYLRSKGYALPWMGLTVEEMIEAGWVKLIEP